MPFNNQFKGRVTISENMSRKYNEHLLRKNSINPSGLNWIRYKKIAQRDLIRNFKLLQKVLFYEFIISTYLFKTEINRSSNLILIISNKYHLFGINKFALDMNSIN